MICKICGNSKNNKEFQIREMMFGVVSHESAFAKNGGKGCVGVGKVW